MSEEQGRVVTAMCEIAVAAAACLFYWQMLPESAQKQATRQAKLLLADLRSAVCAPKRVGLPKALASVEKVAKDAWQRCA